MIIKPIFEKSDLIKPKISNLSYNINQFKLLSKRESNIIDLSEIDWINPLTILPIASLLFNLSQKSYDISIVEPLNLNIRSYLKTIKFFKGIHSIDYFRRHKNYIPITSLPNTSIEVKNREQVLSCLLRYTSGTNSL